MVLSVVVQDATELVAKLRAYHNTSQLQEDKVSEHSVTRFPSPVSPAGWSSVWMVTCVFYFQTFNHQTQ